MAKKKDRAHWVVRRVAEGLRVTIHDGEDSRARVIVTEIMAPAEYHVRAASSRSNRLVSVTVKEV